ncbi:GNAT family N-acetyltransferase [Paracoccus sp. MBLB3053]|uniref:GNAT family N-acetyltransferase n=1 Tax=Paracoccus aurantius TaxID=3073814 RepID=A0ABU2HPQ1_9RHOB|nr:GNAT family N-acetyltransferase [Paracoccus sp. MBLB3053]MDS9467026.1 GNAT family N-acetyltransferase [Paracoccus sp. MBLB3053]
MIGNSRIDGFAIRRACPEDEAAIRHCAETAFARYVPRMGRRPAPMDVDFERHIGAGEVHAALDLEQALLGYVILIARPDHLLLDSLAVLPEAKGMGLGKALLAFCEDETRRQGFDEIRLYTNARMTENLTLYPHFGYVETDRRRDEGFDRVFFRKKLG